MATKIPADGRTHFADVHFPTAGLDLSHVVKVTAHLATLSDFAAYNEVYQRLFPAPYPVRTTVGSELNDILVEIDVVAALP